MSESTGLPLAADLPRIMVTRRDHDRLRTVIERARGCVDDEVVGFLGRELDRAVICRIGVVPRDIVTMNSRVFYRRHVGLPIETRTLVYDEEDGAVGATLPVLSPLGAALLGVRAGGRMPYATIDGARWVAAVEWIAYQPEAEGRLLRAPYRYWPSAAGTERVVTLRPARGPANGGPEPDTAA